MLTKILPLRFKINYKVVHRSVGSPDNAMRYCATTFVSRVCVKAETICEVDLRPGDRCYLSLVPQEKSTTECTAHQSTGPGLAFGEGVHTCIGKRLSFVILDIAAEVAREHFAEGFTTMPDIAPGGAFLAFKEML